MSLRKKTDPLARAGLWLACVALIALMMVIVGDVVSRNLFGRPVRGAYDLVSIFLLIMIFSGMASVVAQRSEILIDIIDGALSTRTTRALKLLASVTTVAMCVFLLVAMVSPAVSAYRYGDRSLELNLPVWTLWVVAFAGLITVLIVAIARAIDECRGTDIPESDTP
ncbi:TRAP transporter small permease [Pseudoruegeria sp. SK021]|uniref:TRAP transporter small permease n=1 Tax=Pseudoruegeria sp. SK021 TaxID=1933035 RepID=UPI000A25202A|nr:TRAP transporter small permease [Pseudoruegeria sp. SK021]OSP54886.1 hypothetical protein BV911_10480 [Pseudoruegeria sp. SK021]